MFKHLILLSLCASISFCAIHDQAQEVFQDVDRPPHATIDDIGSTMDPRVVATSSSSATATPTPFEVIAGTFPAANVRCKVDTTISTFGVQYIQNSVAQSANCWADGTKAPCKTSGSQFYPKKFNNGDNIQWGTDKTYCTNDDYKDYLEEFPIKIDGTLYGGGNDNSIWRVIYKKKRLSAITGKRELKYCGIVYHSDATHFALCKPPTP